MVMEWCEYEANQQTGSNKVVSKQSSGDLTG